LVGNRSSVFLTHGGGPGSAEQRPRNQMAIAGDGYMIIQ
jgi:hypothetical protein